MLFSIASIYASDLLASAESFPPAFLAIFWAIPSGSYD
jgi:hypothetical protein